MHNHKNKLTSEVNTRRTFAIISHPDAGKTTLTEKLLLFGGAIRLAGTVKGKKSEKHATSDWMKIEQQRGISVTSSVMQFSYHGLNVNILDTPGHQDFSEDTYRTLNAADSAVMLIDAAKGVESQTIKLFEVCRIRSIPIFTFINKMDRYGKDPLELLEEIEQVLGVRSCPMNWPIGMGRDFQGIYDRQKNRLELFNQQGTRQLVPCAAGIEDPVLNTVIDETLYSKLHEHISLLDIAGDPFDRQQIRIGQLTPVFFGSAITNFGVQTFLDGFLDLAPSPTPRKSSIGYIEPAETQFSGFVFKIQANMNPAHRDRVAFLRICSGKFSRGMMANHVRADKKIKLSQPQQFLAQGRNIIEEAYPGDIIGIFDPGIFQIGDTLCEEGSFQYQRLPRFSPEHFARVTVKDAMKHKQFQKGINQLAEEGTVQIFRTFRDRTEDIILGVVGKLQFEVFEYRLKAEYGADILLQHLRFNIAMWVKSDNPEDIRQLHSSSSPCVKDHNGDTVVLYENDFALRWATEKNPRVRFCKPHELSDEQPAIS